MLIRLIISNYRSIRDEVEFNLLPAPYLKRHPHHIYDDSKIRVLKSSVIYGANGAGKSNLISALTILRTIIEEQKVPASTSDIEYRLGGEKLSENVCFEVEFKNNGRYLAYRIEFKNGIIYHESLYSLVFNEKKDDIMIFERSYDAQNQTIAIEAGPGYGTNKQDKMLLQIFSQNLLSPEKPFLSFAEITKKEVMADALTWFANSIQTITPDASYYGLAFSLSHNPDFNDFVNRLLKAFNTGIERLDAEKVRPEDYGLSKDEINYMSNRLHKDNSHYFSLDDSGAIVVLEDDELVVYKPVTYHRNLEGGLEKFEIDQESDGSRRLIDYLPMFRALIEDDTAIVIDEIERSIHPSLLKKLVSMLLSPEVKLKGQLIFTTHECNLLDMEIFRQDEIWFMEKTEGNSVLYPLTDFNVRQDLDLAKGYINGRFGAIPFLGNFNDLNWEEGKDEKETEL